MAPEFSAFGVGVEKSLKSGAPFVERPIEWLDFVKCLILNESTTIPEGLLKIIQSFSVWEILKLVCNWLLFTVFLLEQKTILNPSAEIELGGICHFVRFVGLSERYQPVKSIEVADGLCSSIQSSNSPYPSGSVEILEQEYSLIKIWLLAWKDNKLVSIRKKKNLI